MNIDKDYGIPSEFVINWKSKNPWIYEGKKLHKKINILIVSALMIQMVCMFLIVTFADPKSQIKLIISSSVIISIFFAIAFKYIRIEYDNEVKETILSDWDVVRSLIVNANYLELLRPGCDNFEGLSFSFLKGEVIKKLRALVLASEIGGSREGDIRELIDDVEMFFGRIDRGSLYHFNQLPYEKEIVYLGEKFSCTYFEVVNNVSLGDLCAFLSRNNGVICKGDTRRELPWCLPDDFIPHRKVYVVSTSKEFDGFAFIEIHAQYKQSDGVMICMPNRLEEAEFKSSCLGMVFVRLERVTEKK